MKFTSRDLHDSGQIVLIFYLKSRGVENTSSGVLESSLVYIVLAQNEALCVYDGRPGEFRVLSQIQITPANVELATNSHQTGARLSSKFWTKLN